MLEESLLRSIGAVVSKTRPPDDGHDYENRRWRLNAKQRRFRPVALGAWAASELGARVLGRKVLSPRENTRRCYEDFFDPLCADTGVWPDYTEGYFPNGDESYEDAKDKQLDLILDKSGCAPGTRVLDIGCGNGRLMKNAAARGADVHGITVSRKQAETCRSQGLNAHVCSFEEAVDRFERHSFDIVVLNGPTEHFATEADVLDGRELDVRRETFEMIEHLVKPGGRVFITCIHFRWPTDIAQVVLHPLRHPFGSYYFHCSLLVKIYSGWYPELGTYEKLADELGFDTKYRRDATEDYYLTSKLWSRRLRAFVKDNPKWIARYLTKLWWKDPRYAFYVLLFWMYDPWTWQFRGGDDSPLVHLWLGFERRE